MMRLRWGMGMVGVLGLVAAVFVYPVWAGWSRWGIQDWDVFTFFAATPQVTIQQYGQFPLWNPWFCGGMPLLGRPESPFLSPMFLPVLWWGPLHGLKVLVWLHLWVGLVGMVALGRQQGASRWGAVLAALVYMCGGLFTQHLVVGNINHLGIAFVPWAVWFYLRALEGKVQDSGFGVRGAEGLGDCVACAIALVLMWFGGCPYMLVMTLLGLGCHGLAAVVLREQRVGRVAGVVGMIGGMTLALGAVKFLPAMEFMSQFPRTSNLHCGYSVEALAYALLGRDQTLHAMEAIAAGRGFWRGLVQGINELGIYVGIIPLTLFGVGAACHGRRRAPLLICFLIFLWLAFGVRAPVSLWNFLHQLPVFNIVRNAERFSMIFLLCVAVFAGLGLDRVSGWLARWGRGRVAGVITLVVLVDLAVVVAPLYRQAFTIAPVGVEAAPGGAFVQTAQHYAIGTNGWAQAGDDTVRCAWSSHYPSLLANQGIVQGYEEIPVPMLAVPVESPAYRGEVFLHGTAGEARYVEWTPNRLRMAVAPRGPGWVVVNQNYFTGWHVKGGGRDVESVNGLLAVRVGAEDREVEIFYRPKSFEVGAGISLVAAAGVLVMCVRRRRP